jgi:DDE superfamily endonuclease
MDHLTPSFQLLLVPFGSAFTAPAHQLFCSIVAGWILSMRHRYVTEVIYASGNVGVGHWSRFHRFFSLHVWCLDDLGLILTRSILESFQLQGTITLVVDDTLCRKRGLTLYGAGMHHDPLFSSRALKIVSWGHDWVVLAILIQLPHWAPTKCFALPIACRLYRNLQGNAKLKKTDQRHRASDAKPTKNPKPADHRTRPELGLELITLVAGWFPLLSFAVVADSLYGGKSVLRKIPANVDLISRVHPGGALYEPPAPPTSNRGRPAKKGPRLSSLTEWANDDTPWTAYKFDCFGLHTQLQVKTRQGLYYTAGKDRLLTFVLTRDLLGKRPDQIFYCTRLDWDVRTILSTYAGRWAIEVTFENAKQLLGFEDPANRLPKAILRTAPIALLLYSLVVMWFHQAGHQHVKFPDRPWYKHKAEPSFADMLGTLRRLSMTELWQPLAPRQGRLKKILTWMTEFATRPG